MKDESPDEERGAVRSRPSARVVMLSIAGLWACYFLIATLRGTIVGIDFQAELLWRRALVSLAGIVVTIALWLVLRAADRWSLGAKTALALVAALPAALLIAQVNQWVFAPLEARVTERFGERQGVRLRQDPAGNILLEVPGEPDLALDGAAATAPAANPREVTIVRAPDQLERWRRLSDMALSRYFLLLAWAALYFALLAGARARVAERREGEFRRAAKAAELRSLRYQVNPHFLFNALNSLSALVLTGRPERAERMIQTISRFYRRSLSEDLTGDVALGEEFDAQKLYLEIEQVRFPDRLRTRFDLPDALASVPVPAMILQPLVENSVKYAVAATREPVTIELSAFDRGASVAIAVADDGPGGLAAVGAPSLGIGLANVRDRLRARFGSAAGFETGPDANGYRTVLTIPKERPQNSPKNRRGDHDG